MQIIGRVDPSLGPNSFATGVAARGGKVILHNLSAYDLSLVFGNDPSRNALLMAWQPREFDFCGRQTDEISYSIEQAPSHQIDSPSTVIIGEAYGPGEAVPISHPNYDRLSNVGNQSLPTSSSPGIANDGQPANQRIIESTPGDQTTSSIDITNDGAMLWQVLSLGRLSQIFSIVRGSDTTEASFDIGDPADPAMTSLHGTADNASTAGIATTAITANTSRQLHVYDGSLSNAIDITEYQGTTDPTTYIVPNIGDRWLQG